MKIVLYIAGVLVLLVAIWMAAAYFSTGSFAKESARKAEALFATSQSGLAVVTTEEINNLPEPVQRWLRFSGVENKVKVNAVRLKQTGSFRMAPDADWKPFTADQYFSVDPPGFIWDARIKFGPGLTITIRDEYVDGAGRMYGLFGGLIPVVNSAGPKLDQGAKHRFLSELIWFPTAAVSPNIVWESIDSLSARVTMIEPGEPVSATFTFDETGAIKNVQAIRYRETGGVFEETEWITPVSGFSALNGLHIPIIGEAIWRLPAGPFSYIKLEITDLEYNYPAPYTE